MKLMALIALACGITAAPMIAASPVSADPGTCDGADCVPFVRHNIASTDYCQFKSRYPFGVDASGNTFVCAARNQWVPVAPLAGVRTMRAPCDDKVPGTAQTPVGQLLNCQANAWTTYNDVLYYK